MPDVREKLVEMLDHVQDYGMKRVKDESSILLVHKTNEMVADHLIANGVTIQRWIPVTERLPEPFEAVLVYDSSDKYVSVAYMTRHQEWVGITMKSDVTHWMPLPEEPKEVE